MLEENRTGSGESVEQDEKAGSTERDHLLHALLAGCLAGLSVIFIDRNNSAKRELDSLFFETMSLL